MEVKLRKDREVRPLGKDHYEAWGQRVPGVAPTLLTFGRAQKIKDWLVSDALHAFGKELEAQAQALIKEADADTDQPVYL